MSKRSRPICGRKILSSRKTTWCQWDDHLGKVIRPSEKRWNGGHSTEVWSFRPSLSRFRRFETCKPSNIMKFGNSIAWSWLYLLYRPNLSIISLKNFWFYSFRDLIFDSFAILFDRSWKMMKTDLFCPAHELMTNVYKYLELFSVITCKLTFKK